MASGSNATLVGGGATFQSTGGLYGGCAYISASGSDLQIADNSAFELPQNFTIEFWFKENSLIGSTDNLVCKGVAGAYNFNIFRDPQGNAHSRIHKCKYWLLDSS